MKKYYFIYKTTCVINDKYYIGMHSTNNLNDGYMGSGKRLRNSIKCYGVENHKIEIIEFCNNIEDLKFKESEIVNNILLEDILCMNLVVGGQGGYISDYGIKKGRIKCDEILKDKYGENFRSIIMTEYHDNLSTYEKQVISEKIKEGQKLANFNYATFKGKKHSLESKLKISEKNTLTQKGEKNSQFGTCWINNNSKEQKIKKSEIDIWISNGWKIGRFKR